MTQAFENRLVTPAIETRFDQGRHFRAKIGYILLATEQTIQDDIMKLRPEGVGIHVTRAPITDSITRHTLAAQVDALAQCASLLLPDGSLDVICYACTSGSLIIGEQRVHDQLSLGAPTSIPTSLISCVIRALRKINARKIVVATPYLDEINKLEIAYLENSGFNVLSLSGLNLEKDSDMVRVAPEFISEFALSIDQHQADAIFISCGALRTLEVIDQIESKAGKPVIASNQAMIWDTLRLAGINDKFQGYGTLLSKY